MSTFSPEIIDAVTKHMNGDHSDDNLLIVRAFADPLAEAATMVGLDSDVGIFSCTTGDEKRNVRVPWSKPISERGEIRREVVVLYNAACTKLGVAPRQEH